jgi:hypothetical protein
MLNLEAEVLNLIDALGSLPCDGYLLAPTPTPTPLPVGDFPMCKSKRGKQMTVLVPASKMQRSFDKGLTMGECLNAKNGRVMCKSKRGKLKSMVVPHSKVQRSLDKGLTLGVCRAL